MGQKWTDKQRQAASDRMKERSSAKKATEVRSSMRVPVGGSRNITSVNNTPEGYVDRWVNDKDGRIDRFKKAGYENVQTASVGDSGVDSSHAESGVVSREMGQGVISYLMRQRQEYFKEDQSAKQAKVDATEESIRRDVKNKLKDGHYGSVSIDGR